MSDTVNRIHAYNRQRGRCFYCQWPMWEATFEPEADALTRINAVRRADTKANLDSFRCTAEHLVRKADGGSNRRANIVAACIDCNGSRAERPTGTWQDDRISQNQFDQAGHDKGFDPVFYSMPKLPITAHYRLKWHHNFFVEMPRWQVEVEVMKLGDFSAIGSRYQTTDSIALVYPLFASSGDLQRPADIYNARDKIEGTQLLLESADHRAKLEAVFGDAVVKRQ